MKKTITLLTLTALLSCSPKQKESSKRLPMDKPNIVVFYVDDLGYGDLASYGATGVKTPYVDRIATNGIRYTDAHSSAATCTPSRYSLLTGQHAFRNNAAILPGDAPLLIDQSTPTLPKMLQKAGYKTAVVGKWHLGLGDGTVDWNTTVKPGPLEVGFDYSFLLPATGDRVPTVYVENHNVVNLSPNDSLFIDYKNAYPREKNGISHPHLLRQAADKQHSNAIVNGISRIGHQTGGNSAHWVDEEFPDVFTEKAKSFMRKHQKSPFFLFFSFHDIHVPRLPNKRFEGSSSMGPRGDAIVQMDWMTGTIIEEIEKLGLDKNTLIIFTSDNGPVLNDGYEDQSEEMLGTHKPAGPFRGGKYSAFEAGTRVPMISYWPGTIAPGESAALMSQIDYYASLSAMLNISLDKNEAIDSKNMLKPLLDANEKGRDVLLEEAFSFSLRNNNLKYIAPKTKKWVPAWLDNKKIETGASKKPQLYDLHKDQGEQVNIAKQHPKIVEKMQTQLDSILSIGK